MTFKIINLKKIIAYSSINQMEWILFIITVFPKIWLHLNTFVSSDCIIEASCYFISLLSHFVLNASKANIYSKIFKFRLLLNHLFIYLYFASPWLLCYCHAFSLFDWDGLYYSPIVSKMCINHYNHPYFY